MKNKFILLALLCWQCTMEENKKPEEYNGPMRELNGMLMHYAENNKVKVKITAAVVKEYLGGDREFPDGIHIEFYDDTGLKSSDLRANNAYYFKKENQWRGRGKVIIQNVGKGEELTTEELFWKPDTKKIFTEKFVTIKQPNEVLYGTGLDAAEDLSEYNIHNISGEFDVKE
ncbi:MAG: LPS export ABC transporter periplasmic protein LptC [Candidatus Nephrothrix sp. EaCA]|nr:MAG: LPS export ABC transporter periplasmic protein LptC [Candidatus Nephrothrix sp. EaCA]